MLLCLACDIPYTELGVTFADNNKNGNGFALAHWNGSDEIETQIKKDLKVTIRCIPMDDQTPGICPFSGEHSPQRVIWAKSY